LRRLAEQFEEASAIRLVTENLLARVASRAKMVDGIFKFYAQRSRHCLRIAEPIANVKCLDLTPSFPPFGECAAGRILQKIARFLSLERVS
jgi:hypothetical protein